MTGSTRRRRLLSPDRPRHKEGIALPQFPVCRSDDHFCRSAIWPQPAFRLRTFNLEALSQRVVSQMEEM